MKQRLLKVTDAALTWFDVKYSDMNNRSRSVVFYLTMIFLVLAVPFICISVMIRTKSIAAPLKGFRRVPGIFREAKDDFDLEKRHNTKLHRALK